LPIVPIESTRLAKKSFFGAISSSLLISACIVHSVAFSALKHIIVFKMLQEWWDLTAIFF